MGTDALASARDWDAWIRTRFGDEAEWQRPVGVLHVTAVWRDPRGPLVTIAIRPDSPHSPTDGRLLSLARARVDAIVTSGRILREEPALTHAYLGPEAERAGLAAWRRERLGKSVRARSVVLSSGRDLDLSHPLFRDAAAPIVFTGEEGARRLAPEAARAGVEVVAHPQPGVRNAVAWLRARGWDDVGIETGPSTARALYEDPLGVDELLLSVYEAPQLAPDLRGPRFVEAAEIEKRLPRVGQPFRAAEPSGPWRFERHLRAGSS